MKDTPAAAAVVKDEVVKEAVDKENIVKQLREYRMKMAKQEDLKPFMVFTNREMEALVEESPTTKEDLLQVRGFGKVKVEKYGEKLLGVLGSKRDK